MVLSFLTVHELNFATTSAIYRNMFWKLTLFVVTILLQICVFIHIPILVGID